MISEKLFNINLLILSYSYANNTGGENHEYQDGKYRYMYYVGCTLKGTECVISSDPSCKDGNARFTMVPFKALSNKV